MVVLVADVGGTNTRLALAGPDGTLIAGPSRFRNDDYDSFLSVATAYRDTLDDPDFSGACIAIAGPVSGGSARLTNRDWVFDTRMIGAMLGASNVHLLNDIVALGHCLGGLVGDQYAIVRSGRPHVGGQRLVVGMGTGTNGCAVHDVAGRSTALEAEMGHARLPFDVMDHLRAEIGDAASAFPTTEDLFSGRGLVALHAARTGQDDMPAHEIVSVAEAQPGSAEAKTLDLMAFLVGRLTQELFFYYMPTAGIFFAGSVSRSVLSGPRIASFEAGLQRQGAFSDRVDAVPVYLILEDAAALSGCARLLRV